MSNSGGTRGEAASHPARWLRVQLVDRQGNPWGGQVGVRPPYAEHPLPTSWEQPPAVIAIPVDRAASGFRIPADPADKRLLGTLAGRGVVAFDIDHQDALMLAVVGGGDGLGYFDGEVRLIETQAPGCGGNVRVHATLGRSQLGAMEVHATVAHAPFFSTSSLWMEALQTWAEAEGRPMEAGVPVVVEAQGYSRHSHGRLVVCKQGSDFPLLCLGRYGRQPKADPHGARLDAPLTAVLPGGAYRVLAWNSSRTHGRVWAGGAFGEGTFEVAAGGKAEAALELDGGVVLEIEVKEVPKGIHGVAFTFIDQGGAEHPVIREVHDFKLSAPSFTTGWPAGTHAVSEPLPRGRGRLRTEFFPGGKVTEEPIELARGAP